MAWGDLEQEIAAEFDELTGFLAWQQRQAMRFFTRSLVERTRPRMTESQRRAMRALYRRRWWQKMRRDPSRYDRYLGRVRRWRRRWLRSLSPAEWREYRARANVYQARYRAGIRARPNGWEMFVERRRGMRRAREVLLAGDPVLAARSRARRRWLAGHLRKVRRAASST